jgi:hypothetical protein
MIMVIVGWTCDEELPPGVFMRARIFLSAETLDDDGMVDIVESLQPSTSDKSIYVLAV